MSKLQMKPIPMHSPNGLHDGFKPLNSDRVRFDLGKGNYVEVVAKEDGELEVRTSGSDSPLMSLLPLAANQALLVPLYWNERAKRYLPRRAK